MESGKAGAPKELETRPYKQAETREGDPNGKREERVLPEGTCVLREYR